MAVSVGECMCLLRIRVCVGDLMLLDVCEASCVLCCVVCAPLCPTRFMQRNLSAVNL